MAITGAAIAAKTGGGPAVKRVGAYIKAHWKELLALTFAAIPAIFILLHTGARKAVQQTLTLPPIGTGVDSSATTPAVGTPASSTSNSSSSNPVAAVTDAAAAAVQKVTSSTTDTTSVNGSNPRAVAPPSTYVPPPVVKRVTPPPPPPPATSNPRPITIVPDLTQRSKRGGPVG